MKENTHEKNNGITLIALIITIIVLIILAGISINLLLGENGIIRRTKETKEKQTIEEIREKLEMTKGLDYIEQKGNNSIDTYFATLEKERIEPYTITNKQKVSEDIGIIEVENKYSYLMTIENNKNIKIEYEGKIDEVIRNPYDVIITITGEEQQNNLPVTLNANIKINGKEATDGKYVINTIKEELGTEESLYTEQISSGNIEVKLEKIGDYYIHTLTKGQYGKNQETIKGPINITPDFHEHTSECYESNSCYAYTTERQSGGKTWIGYTHSSCGTEWKGVDWKDNSSGYSTQNKPYTHTYDKLCCENEGKIEAYKIIY